MIRRVAFAVLAFFYFAVLAQGAFVSFQVNSGVVTPPSFTPTWQDMPIGDGGQKTSFDYHLSTGLLLVRNDTWGGHYRKTTGTCSNGLVKTFPAPCWEQVVTSTSMPSGDVSLDLGASGNVGTVELIACEGNQNVFYMLHNTYLYVSTNKGVRWDRAGTGGGLRTSQGANNGPKDRGKFLWCDPADANGNILYAATLSGAGGSVTGVFKTANGTAAGSATFTQVTGIGTPTAGFPQLLASDPASAVVGGVTQTLYIWTQGSGVYGTTNGNTFSLTSGSPTSITAQKLRVDQFSQVWVIDCTATMRVRSAAGTWGTRTYGGTNGACNIAFDHTSAAVGTQRVFASWADGNIAVSNDNGATWTGNALANTFTAPAGQAPWLATTSQCNNPCSFGTYFNVLDYIFDANLKVWAAGGISPWWTATLTGAANTQWSADAVGIEQLVTNVILAPFGSSPTMATWDRGVLRITVPGQFPTIQVPNLTTISQIQAAWSASYSGITPSYMVALISSNAGSGDYYAYTTDGGWTWTKFPAYPAGSIGSGGAIATSTPTSSIVYPYISGFSNGLQYTTNGGLTSWAKSTVSGQCSDDFITSFFNNRQPLAADQVTANKFYVVDGSQNFCVSTDGGATFTKVFTGPIAGTFVYRDVIKAMPGQANTFFYTLGPQNTPAGLIRLYKTTNGGGNLAAIGNIRDPWYVGFGADQGSGQATMYALGSISGVQCICKSTDGGTTWTALNTPSTEFPWPKQSFDFMQDISGDMNFKGRVITSFVGSGAAFYDEPTACPAVHWTNIKPNQTISGSSVAITAEHSGDTPLTNVNFYYNKGSGDVQIGSTQTGGPAGTVYSVNLNATAIAGAGTIKVEGVGNGCTAGSSGNFMQMPVTFSNLLAPANDNAPLRNVA